MSFIIALIGRPNVGKSMLFNRLTHTRDALVSNDLGLTRDRQYGDVKWRGYKFIIIDTGGITRSQEGIGFYVNYQSFIAAEEADLILFVVDARSGIIDNDFDIVKYLYKLKKDIIVVINKVDGVDIKYFINSFYAFGIKVIIPISAYSGYGIKKLLKQVVHMFNINLSNDYSHNILQHNNVIFNSKKSVLKSVELPIQLAIFGRPNVGKSTFVNCILGKERVIVYDTPGTTRDNIYVPMSYSGYSYILIDTPGIRRPGKISQMLEKYSVIKALQVIKMVHVVLLILDANDGVTDQDLFLLNFIFSKGKALVIAVNKWDKLSESMRKKIKDFIIRRISFVNFVKVHFISALYNIGICNIMQSVLKAYQCSIKHINTGYLTRVMYKAVNKHKPPLICGRRPQLKYAHMGGCNPVVIVIHGSWIDGLSCHYQRYLIHYFSNSLCITGNMIRIKFNDTKKLVY